MIIEFYGGPRCGEQMVVPDGEWELRVCRNQGPVSMMEPQDAARPVDVVVGIYRMKDADWEGWQVVPFIWQGDTFA